jgi:hypothetical protein
VAGNIAHDYRKRTIRGAGSPQKVKIVPADFIAGNISAGDIQSIYLRCLLGKQASLDLTGQGQGLFMFGHVRDKGHVAENKARIVTQRVGVDLNRHTPTVTSDDINFKWARLATQQILPVGGNKMTIFFSRQIKKIFTDEVLAGITDHLAVGMVEVDDLQSLIHEQESLTRCFDDATVFLLVFA